MFRLLFVTIFREHQSIPKDIQD